MGFWNNLATLLFGNIQEKNNADIRHAIPGEIQNGMHAFGQGEHANSSDSPGVHGTGRKA